MSVSVCLSVCLPACLPAWLSVYVSACLHVRMYVGEYMAIAWTHHVSICFVTLTTVGHLSVLQQR